MTARNIYSFSGLCDMLGKDALYVKNIQRALDVQVSSDDYPDAYLRFLQKVVALRTCGVSLEAVAELLELERKILKLLHVDSLSKSETWYLSPRGESNDGLLLTGYTIGFTTSSSGLQDTLDFREREAEMFTAPEMGVDVRKVLNKYVKLRDGMLERMQKEILSVERSAALARKMAARIGKG